MPIAPTSSRSACSASARGDDAVASACGVALDSLASEPGLLVAFTSGIEDAGRAAAQLGEAAGGTPSVGMTGKGVFADNDPIDDGCVVVAFDKATECGLGVGRNAGEDFKGAGHRAANEALERLSDPAGLLLLFVDGRAGDLGEAIAGAYEASGPDVPTAGGAASGTDPAQYAGGEALTDAVVALAVRSRNAIGVGNAHSCSVVGRAVVTSSDERVIVEIDGKPAEQVYLQRVGGRAELSDEAFEAMAITHPLAQPEAHGNRRLRHVLGRTGDGGLVCSTNIEAGAVVEFTVLSLEELVHSACDSVKASLESLGHHDPEAALLFDCAGRRRVLGHGQAQEVQAISQSFDVTPPLAGLYTDGEVARLKGAKGDYNHAVVTVSFA
jgi:hypothetical protein